MSDPYEGKPFRPLRVRAYLQTPVLCDDHLPLDGILYYQAVREKLGPQEMSLPGQSKEPEAITVRLPFMKMCRQSDAWFYASSFAQWPEHVVYGQDHWNKRFDQQYADLVDFGKKKARVDTTRGAFKSYHMPVHYRHALYVEWYCMGARADIERLLPFCTHLGKKTSQGYGAVLRWEVTDWPENWSVRGPAGKLMRAVPVRRGGVLYGVRPSYWHPRHQFACKLP